MLAGAVGVAADPPVVSLASFSALGGRPRSGGPEGVQEEGGCDAGHHGGEEAQGRLGLAGH